MLKKFSFPLLAVFSAALILTGAECAFGEAVHLAADSPFIRYYGRWEMQDKTALSGQGATYIRAKFTGSSDLRADLTGKGVFWEYSIDGRSFQRLEVKGNGPLTLGKGLAKDEEHIVTLVRSSEGQAGISEFIFTIVINNTLSSLSSFQIHSHIKWAILHKSKSSCFIINLWTRYP